METEISIVSRQEIIADTLKLSGKIQELVITDSEWATEAKALEKECTSLEKLIETKRTDITGPMNEQIKKINESAKILVAPITQAKEDIRKKQIEYAQKLERERMEKENKILQKIQEINSMKSEVDLEVFIMNMPEAPDSRISVVIEARRSFFIEQERLEEMKKLQKAEQERLDKIAKEQGDKAAELAKKESDAALKQKQIEDEMKRIQEDDTRRELEATAAKETKESSKSYGQVKWLRKVTQFEIIDEILVPRAFCTSDISKIKAAFKLGHTEIPGVRIWEEDKIQ